MATATLKGRITLNDSALHAGFKKGILAAQGFAKGMSGILKSAISSPIAGIGAAVGAYFTYQTFKSGIGGVIAAGTEVERLHRRIGGATESIAALQTVFKQANVSSDAMVGSIARMRQNLAEAVERGGPAASMLKGIGLNAYQLSQLSLDKQFQSIGQAIDRISDPAARASMAMLLFGEQGAQLLPVFEDFKSVDFGNLRDQSAMLARSAGRYAEVTRAFKMAKSNLQGVFLGLSEALAPALLAAAKFFNKQNATGFGETLGKHIQRGVDILIGAFKNPSQFLPAFGLKLAATLMDGVSLMGSGFDATIDAVGKQFGANLNIVIANFSAGFLKASGGMGKVIIGTFIGAFSKAIAFLQAGIEKAMDRLDINKKGNFIDGIHERYLASREKMMSDIANDESLPLNKRQEASDELRKLVAARHQLYAKQSPAESFEAIYNRKLSEGVKFGLGEGKTSDQWIAEGVDKIKASASSMAKELSLAIGQAGNAGTAVFHKFADAKLAEIRKTGSSTIAAVAGSGASTGAVSRPGDEPAKPVSILETFTGVGGAPRGLNGATMGQGLDYLTSQSASGPRNQVGRGGVLSQGAYNQSNVLSAAERRTFEDAAVASGTQKRQGSTKGAFNTVRSGDKARQKEAAQAKERERLGIQSNNEWLAKIFGSMETAWGNS